MRSGYQREPGCRDGAEECADACRRTLQPALACPVADEIATYTDSMPARHGADFALLLLGGFRELVDCVSAELEVRGYVDVRPVHDFAIEAIRTGADNVSELGRQMSVSKQSAAKTVAVLVERNYVARELDPRDGRRMLLRVTSRGLEMQNEATSIFNDLYARWQEEVGAEAIASMEQSLKHLVGNASIRFDLPRWMANPGG